MNEISQNIFDKIIQKAKDLYTEGKINFQDGENPEIYLEFSELPQKCFEDGNLIEYIDSIKLYQSTNDTDFNGINVFSSYALSTKMQKLKFKLSHSIWQKIIDKEL